MTKEDMRRKLERGKLVSGNCWRWLGSHNHSGYGSVRMGDKTRSVHRVSAWIFLDFDLDSDLNILHSNDCEFRDCWIPAHLRPGTDEDNMSDYSESTTHCPQGHEYTPENTRNYGSGKQCRLCHNLRNRLYMDEYRRKR